MTTASRQAPKVQSHAQERAGAPAPEFRNPHFYRAHAIMSRLQSQQAPSSPARPVRKFPFLMRSRVLILCVNSISPSIVSSATELNALLSKRVMRTSLHAMPFEHALEYAKFLGQNKVDLAILFYDSPEHAREFIARAREKSPLTRLVAVCRFSEVQARELAEVADLVISPPFYVSALYPQLERALASPPKQATR